MSSEFSEHAHPPKPFTVIEEGYRKSNLKDPPTTPRPPPPKSQVAHQAPSADESYREVRRAHQELNISLLMLSEKLAEIHAGIDAGTIDGMMHAGKAFVFAENEIEAAHGHLAAARDDLREYVRRSRNPRKVEA
jgi:hypothetical protein